MKRIFGIRREDKNPWERRAPLIPTHVRELIQNHSLEFWLQPSAIRIFPDEDYAREGAKISEDLSPCHIILAIKEIPLRFFKKEKVYIFFSHTAKGQPHNMPMLRKMVGLGCSLIDYEKIVNEKGQRLLFFGNYAGHAGMVNSLWALGQRLLRENKRTPFLHLKQMYHYSCLAEAKEEVQKIGWEIHNRGLDAELVPLVCGFTGYGHVSQGAQEVFDFLPFEEIEPSDLPQFFKKKLFAANKVYKVVFKEEHMVRPKSPEQKFNLQDYYQNPEKYEPVLEEFLPFLTVLVNCIYWAPQYPRFVSKAFLRKLFGREKIPRLRVIGDISCDIEGSVECTIRATTPKDPVFVYDPIREEAQDGFDGQGIVVMAEDNLPAEISLEASTFFSQALKPFIPYLARADFWGKLSRCHLPDPLRRGLILYRGEFTPEYKYMASFISERED